MDTSAGAEQLVVNKRLVKTINSYWKDRGVTANARVKLKKVLIDFKCVGRERVALPEPRLVKSYEIVSNLIGGGPNGADW